jgi:hypothetical protein
MMWEPAASLDPGEEGKRKEWMPWMKEKKGGVVVCTLNPSSGMQRQRQVHLWEFKASLVYITHNMFQGYRVRPCLKGEKDITTSI